jgi:hypothetical protein
MKKTFISLTAIFASLIVITSCTKTHEDRKSQVSIDSETIFTQNAHISKYEDGNFDFYISDGKCSKNEKK